MKTTRSKQWKIVQSNLSQMWRLVCVQFVFTICFCLASHAQSSELINDIKIQYQTFNIDTKSITHPFTSFSIKDVVKYHGLYFCLFKEEAIDRQFFNQFSHILVIQPDDFSFSEVDIPKGVVFSDYSQIFPILAPLKPQ